MEAALAKEAADRTDKNVADLLAVLQARVQSIAPHSHKAMAGEIDSKRAEAYQYQAKARRAAEDAQHLVTAMKAEANLQAVKQGQKLAAWATLAQQSAVQAEELVKAAIHLVERATPGDAALPVPPPPPRPDGGLIQLREQALDMDLTGLAFSGGGIRSATFALGVLQALASLRLLRRFDYLSTVSGGGYIGGWLAAWIKREGSFANVEQQLAASRVDQSQALRQVRVPPTTEANSKLQPLRQVVDEEPEPVYHLRSYSRYLTPRPGFFSVDTWTLGSIYLRNLLVNLLIILPAALALVLLAWLLVWWFAVDAGPDTLLPSWSRRTRATLLFLAAASVALLKLASERGRLAEAAHSRDQHIRQSEGDATTVRHWLIFPLLLAAVSGTWIFSINPPRNQIQKIRVSGRAHLIAQIMAAQGMTPPGAALGSTMQVVVAGSISELTPPPVPFKHTELRHLKFDAINHYFLVGMPNWEKFIILFTYVFVYFSIIGLLFNTRAHWTVLYCDAIRGGIFGFLLFLVLKYVVWPLSYPALQADALATLGVPVFFLIFILSGYLEMAVAGSLLDEYEREWRSRLGAYLWMYGVAWLTFFGATFYLPQFLHWLGGAGKPVLQGLLGVLWAAISGGGAWAGRRNVGAPGSGRSLALLAIVAPPVFLVGLLTMVAMLLAVLLDSVDSNFTTYIKQGVPKVQGFLIGGLVLAGGLTCLFGFIINVNHFSMHMLYANRLVRCYLGASRRKRTWSDRVTGPFTDEHRRASWDWLPGVGGAPTNAEASQGPRRENAFTGFDPNDDFALADLQVLAGYRGPYPLLNTALNLVAGSELALQDRKAESFVLTPDYCGSSATGYGATPARGNERTALEKWKNLTLGRAVTISGAAVDPNMGIHQSGPMTALMTVFNTRLGWWMQNPARYGERWTAAAPGAGFALWNELFGQTDEDHAYVHLSDGGHFENLGVYELIRRRCRYIVVTDVDTSRQAASENLANLIRMVQIDFGIRIDIETSHLRQEEPDRLTKWHCAIGLVRYDDVDPAAVAGILVYLRTSLTGDEPSDIQEYAHRYSAFPHQSTTDQFFTEAQFESYRNLGFHIAQEVFAEAALQIDTNRFQTTDREQTRRLFARVRRRWFPPPPAADAEFVDTAEKSVAIEQNLRSDPNLRDLSRELYPEAVARSPVELAELHTVNDMLQVMEIAWFSMDLKNYFAHPLNRGWMNLFRRWTGSDAFSRYWPFLRAEYSEDFVRFCERALNLHPTSVAPLQLGTDPSTDPILEKVLTILNAQFIKEWQYELQQLGLLGFVPNLADRVRLAQREAPVIAGRKQAPLVWVICLQGTEATGPILPCGVAIASPAVAPPKQALELLVWLRGPYRNLGIGRQCVRGLLDKVDQTLTGMPTDQRPTVLLVRYPESGVSHAERLDKAMWMNFFFDYGFRNLGRPDSNPELRLITLARDLDE
jgi:hypothetical protein